MPEEVNNSLESADYRFIDNGDPDTALEEKRKSLSVEFYPSVEDYVHICQEMAKRHPMPSIAKIALQVFFATNALALPVTLFSFDHLIAGIIAFAVNLSLAIAFIPSLFRADYRRYYLTYFKDAENQLVNAEIDSRGLSVTQSSNSSVFSWVNIKEMSETKDTIFFFLAGAQAIAIRKSGFAYDAQKDDFIRFAKDQMNLPTSQIPSESLDRP